MDKYNLRKGNLTNSYRFKENDLIDYILCSECGEYVYEYCAIHGPLLIIPDDEINDGYKKSFYVDAADANNSNWMRYVNCSRHWSEQNLVAYLHKGKLYFRTIKIIPKFTELLVFYGAEFANMLGINLQKYNSPITFFQNTDVSSNHNLEGSKVNRNDEQINLQLTISHEANHIKNMIQNTNENFNIHKLYVTPNNSQENINLPLITNDYKHLDIDNINIKNDYNVSKITINDINKNSSKKHKYICNICNYEMVKESSLFFHLRVHTCKNIYSCKICKYITDRKYSLRDHIIKTHTKVKELKFACHICHKIFNRIFDLNQHTKNQICLRSLKCNNCQRKFNRNSDLNRHVRNQICKKTFECDMCQSKFSKLNDLNRHVKTHGNIISCEMKDD